eukprot:evm.model.scf_853EXC.5 EVM.evm.TU.scf_853EXC.5   scf_853EXC:28406-44371(+)
MKICRSELPSDSEASGSLSDGGPSVLWPKGRRSARRRRVYDKVAASGGGRDDDLMVARQLDRALNQSGRPTRRAAQQANRRLQGAADEDSDSSQGGRYSDAERPRRSTRRNNNKRRAGASWVPGVDDEDGESEPDVRWAPRARKSQRSVARVSYRESSCDTSDGEGGKKKRRIVPALEEEGMAEQDDEVERVLGYRDPEGMLVDPADPWATREFHVKWKRYSYIHCSWDRRATLCQLPGYKRVLNYMRTQDERSSLRSGVSREEIEVLDVEEAMEAQLVEEHKQIERVVAERRTVHDELKYLIKWQGLPYAECTWETSEDVFTAGGLLEVDAFKDREQRLLRPSRPVDGERRSFQQRKGTRLEQQPAYLGGGSMLRDYQLDGLNWLIYSWSKDNNAILADEMGLGKTIQCVAFLAHLTESLSIMGPFLVVVPLSTVPNWIKEFRKWCPQVNVVVYVGDSSSREVIRAFEFPNHGRSTRPFKFEVLITTFDFVLKDAAVLGRVRWHYLLVDEAHRLKNPDSSLYKEMIGWNIKNKLLVTGTPLQNTLRELWALLYFLVPNKFPDCKEFEENYSLENPQEVARLHADLRPYLLRRVIKDVEKSLPPKRECILRVERTPLQRQYYRWVLSRNFEELNKGTSGGGHVSLLNIISELKKVCNHPFLFESAEQGYRGSKGDESAVDRLIMASGKTLLLDKLLTKLKETGHRVLIFSQMVRLLDILSEYLRLKGYHHQRLDGSTPATARHQAMEHFNAPGSEDFAFLLSTRAGGLGINLATADTVIIFDSDWNPQNDLQAMSRAHRIGQTETVNIYRLVTRGSVEEDILERAKKKMVLDHLVIQRMDTSGRTVMEPQGGTRSIKKMFGKDELAAILRFGAEDLFKNNDAEEPQEMLEEDIDTILERAEVVDSAKDDNGARDFLNQFNVATFRSVLEDDSTFWSRLIPESKRPVEQQVFDSAALGPRAARLKAEQAVGAQMHSSGSDVGSPKPKPSGLRNPKGGQRAKRPASAAKPAPVVSGAVLRIDAWPENARAEEASPQNSGESAPSQTITKRDATAFVRAVRRFGLQARLLDIARDTGPVLLEASEDARLALWQALVNGCKSAVKGSADPKEAKLDFFGEAVRAQHLLSHLNGMEVLAARIQSVKDPLNFRLDTSELPVLPRWAESVSWTSRDDSMLLLGVYFYGLGGWEKMAGDDRLQLGSKLRSAFHDHAGVPGQNGMIVGPKGTQLEVRIAALLRRLYDSVMAKEHGGRAKEPTKRPKSSDRLPSTSGRSADPAETPARRAATKRSLPQPEARQGAGDKSKRRREGDGSGKPGKGSDVNEGQWRLILEPVNTEVTKLRALHIVDLPQERLVRKTKKYLRTLGQHIDKKTRGKKEDFVRGVWNLVASLVKNGTTGEKLRKMYVKIMAQAGSEGREEVEGGQKRNNDQGGASARTQAQSIRAPKLGEAPAPRRHTVARTSPNPDAPPLICRTKEDFRKLMGGVDRDRVERP